MAEAQNKPSLRCSRCGKTFGSPQELHEHEKNCKSSGRAAENQKAGSEEKAKTEMDMLIEDRFEATDN